MMKASKDMTTPTRSSPSTRCGRSTRSDQRIRPVTLPGLISITSCEPLPTIDAGRSTSSLSASASLRSSSRSAGRACAADVAANASPPAPCPAGVRFEPRVVGIVAEDELAVAGDGDIGLRRGRARICSARAIRARERVLDHPRRSVRSLIEWSPFRRRGGAWSRPCRCRSPPPSAATVARRGRRDAAPGPPSRAATPRAGAPRSRHFCSRERIAGATAESCMDVRIDGAQAEGSWGDVWPAPGTMERAAQSSGRSRTSAAAFRGDRGLLRLLAVGVDAVGQRLRALKREDVVGVRDAREARGVRIREDSPESACSSAETFLSNFLTSLRSASQLATAAPLTSATSSSAATTTAPSSTTAPW